MQVIDQFAEWVRICRVDDIPPLGARVLQRTGEDDIALFRTASDAVHAMVGDERTDCIFDLRLAGIAR